jgi:hypothetical protein
MQMRGPTTWDEYLDLVHQAVYEVDELKACMMEEEDMDDTDLYNQYVGPLDVELRKLYDDMVSGRYQYPADTDLGFMPLVRQYGRFIPFRGLLELINQTHRNGLA